MTLKRHEQRELQELLGKDQATGHLSQSEEQRLRLLVARQNPKAAGLPAKDLVTAGLVVLGATILLRAFGQGLRPSPRP